MRKFIKCICVIVILCIVLAISSAAAVVTADINYRNIRLHTMSADDQNMRTVGGVTSLVTPPPLSHALNSIRSNTVLRKWTLVNNEVTFRPEEFEDILGQRRLRSITIVELPNPYEGVLTLGGTAVTAGQTISRENIRYMRLVPYPDRLGTITFSFRDGASPDHYAILCSVNILETLNFAPTAYPMSITTQQNTPIFRAMRATDPDGDAIEFRIIRAPRRGLLEVRDNGAFVYRPNHNFTGNDSFVYRVRDENGNWSNPATVDIRVTRAAATVRFTDMTDHWAANAAIRGVAAGFIDVSPDFRFNPSNFVTRAEFVYMALRAAQLDRNLPETAQTVFADEDDIPDRFKLHVSAAYDLGVVNGSVEETGIYFDPNIVITRAEAAVILNNILQIPTTAVSSTALSFRDSAQIPYWALPHVVALNRNGIINGNPCGNFDPYGLLNRAQSAELLSNMLDYNESNRRPTRWWANLFG